jgi:hypothetical protein
MHLYLFVRGKYEQVKLWESHAQATYWKLRRLNLKTKKEEIILVQGALRMSVLGAYEYIFPKEALAEVCSYFGINEGTIFRDSNTFGLGNIPGYTRHFCMRKIFGCKKISKKILEKAKTIPDSFSTEEFERCGSNCKIPGVAIHVIGIKEDKMGEMITGDNTYYYELL